MSVWVIAGLVIGVPIVVGEALMARRLSLDLAEARRRGLNSGAFDRWRDRPKRSEVLASTHDLCLTTLFALTYVLAPLLQRPALFTATAVYVGANALVFIVSRNFRQSMLLVAWVSRVAIVGTGALTLWLHDDTFIKMNRTLSFGILALWSAASVMIGRPRLERFALKKNLQNVSAEGWRALTVFSAQACTALALLNELIWRNLSTGFWVAFQLWGWILAELLLWLVTLPLLREYGFVATVKGKKDQPE
jgi:intracellular septation protein